MKTPLPVNPKKTEAEKRMSTRLDLVVELDRLMREHKYAEALTFCMEHKLTPPKNLRQHEQEMEF